MTESQKPLSLRISDRLTTWVGSPTSIIIHTVFFVGIFALVVFDVSLEQILLILTTAVSLEAIYLAIFIQMTVNRHTESLQEVEEEIEDIGDDLEELGDEIDEISEDIDKIQEEEAEEGIAEEKLKLANRISLNQIESSLQQLLTDIEALKRNSPPK